MIGGNLNPIIQVSKIRKTILNKTNKNDEHSIFESISDNPNIKSRKITPIKSSELPVSSIINEDLFLIKANLNDIKLLNMLGLNTESFNYVYLVKDRSNNLKSAFSLKEKDKYISEISFLDIDKNFNNFKEAIDRLLSLNMTSEYYINESTNINKININEKYILE